MPEYLLKVRPFVVRSKLDGIHDDLLHQGEVYNNDNDNGENVATVDGSEPPFPLELRKFIIEDNGQMLIAVFSARKAGNPIEMQRRKLLSYLSQLVALWRTFCASSINYHEI